MTGLRALVLAGAVAGCAYPPPYQQAYPPPVYVAPAYPQQSSLPPPLPLGALPIAPPPVVGALPLDAPPGSVPGAGMRDSPMADSPLRDSPLPDGPVLDGRVLDGRVPDGRVPDGRSLDAARVDVPPPAGSLGTLPADPGPGAVPLAPAIEASRPASDPVTDLLLTPLPQRDVAAPDAPPAPTEPAPAAPARTEPARTEPAQAPLMGFRPMRGQTRPTP